MAETTTHKWNSGDRAMVTIARADTQGHHDDLLVPILGADGREVLVPVVSLTPMPYAALAAANARVAEAAERWNASISCRGGGSGSGNSTTTANEAAYTALSMALYDRRALLAPPVPVDPMAAAVVDLVEAAADLCSTRHAALSPYIARKCDAIRRALDAVEAARAKP